MLKGTRLYSILANKCPRCHEGNFFIGNNPYHINEFDKQHTHCTECGESFSREVGFYYGAMYATYGITVLLGLLLFSLFYAVLGFHTLTFLASFTLLILLLAPWIFRTGRLIWINIFVGYKKKPAEAAGPEKS